MAAFVLASAALGGLALAQPRGGPGDHPRAGDSMDMFGGRGGPMAHRLDRMLDGLGATPDQRNRIRQIATAAEADLKAQRDAGRTLRERAMKLFTAPTVDASAAESLRQEMSAQQDQSSRRMLDAMLEISKVLTPEQRAKIGSRMQERQAVMNDRHQRMAREHGQPPMPPPGPKP